MGDYTEFGQLKYDPREIQQRGYGMAAAGPGDDRLIVLFYNKSVLNIARSKQEGKRIFESREFVKIQTPGETLNILDRPVQETDKQRWPQQWDRFCRGNAQIPDGIPISLLFPDRPNISDMLQSNSIHTVEQLANLSGHAIQSIGMGCQEWVNKAGKYMEQANRGVDYHRFNKALEEKDQQIATLTRQVEEMSRRINDIMHLRDDTRAPMPGPDFDVQSAQIAALKTQEVFAPPPVQFSSDMNQRRRPGRPAGSRNKPKE
jgi:hypothetical protein